MISFSSLYRRELSKIYSVEKVCSLGMGKGIPLKKDRKQMKEMSIDGTYTCYEKYKYEKWKKDLA